MRGTTTPVLALVVLTTSTGAAFAQPILQGEQGLAGDASVLECDGDDCTLNQNLGVDGDLAVEDASFSGDATAGQAGAFGSLAVGSLAATESPTLPDCPNGYTMNYSGVCEREVVGGVHDEMVPVGDLWIDRYEISVWETADCSGEQYGDPTDGDDFPDPGFPDNGNWDTPAYACSVAGEYPSAHMTWFQAQQACALAGKSLCTNAQWQAAAAGTTILGCNTGGAGGQEGCDSTEDPWPSGSTECGGCESAWGAMDMVGNVWEWAADWQGHPGWNGTANVFSTEYGEDGYWAGGPVGADMATSGTDGSWRPFTPAFAGNGDGVGEDYGPAAYVRGSYWDGGVSAGIFAMGLWAGPSQGEHANGARCCLER